MPLVQGRLLMISSFEEKLRHPTMELAQERNEIVAALADRVAICKDRAVINTFPMKLKAINKSNRLK